MTREEFVRMRIADLKKEIERLELSLNPKEGPEEEISPEVRKYADSLKKELFEKVSKYPGDHEWEIRDNDYMISNMEVFKQGFLLAEREIRADYWKVEYSTVRSAFGGMNHIIKIWEQ